MTAISQPAPELLFCVMSLEIIFSKSPWLLSWASELKVPSPLPRSPLPAHDDVIIWKHFLHYWPFVRGIPAQRPVTRGFDVFFDLRLNQQLSTRWRRWWFETPSWSLWRHCNAWLPCLRSLMSCNDMITISALLVTNDSPHKGPIIRNFRVFYVVNNLLNKPSRCR